MLKIGRLEVQSDGDGTAYLIIASAGVDPDMVHLTEKQIAILAGYLMTLAEEEEDG